MQVELQLLPWDTAHFGLNIAVLRVAQLSAGAIANALEFCEDSKIDCLYYLAHEDDTTAAAIALAAGFAHVDDRVTLVHDAPAAASDEPGLRDARASDLDALGAIAR